MKTEKLKNGLKLISVSNEDFVNGVFHNENVTEVGSCCFRCSALTEVSLPNATTFGSNCFYYCSALKSVSLPNATTFGSFCFCFYDCSALKSVSLPSATTFGSDCFCSCSALKSVSLPNATTFGSDCFYDCSALTEVSLPNATTFGSYCFNNCSVLTKVKIKTHKLIGKNVDGYYFVIDSKKTSKEIIIYTGYNLVKIINNEIIKENCFVCEKNGFFAHGETIKKSIQDLNYKIVVEKLKKEPITKDEVITIERYRAVTGSCELGIKSWMQSNNISEEMQLTCEKLLPILEKTNAYGFEKFKNLVK